MATIGKVEPFQIGVDNWEQYTERLEQYFAANSITEEAKKRAVFFREEDLWSDEQPTGSCCKALRKGLR